jgi:hypothetical protein
MKVTIIKTVITVVEVEAISKVEAKNFVKNYGLIEAASDLPVISEDVLTRIGAVEN